MTRDQTDFTLRPWAIEDVPALAFHANDRRIWSELRGRFPQPYRETDAAKWIARWMSPDAPGVQLAIVVDSEPVGGIGIEVAPSRSASCGELGYWLSATHQGTGIVSRAVPTLVRLSFGTMCLDRLRAVVRDTNLASKRILEKSGFGFESRVRLGGRRPSSHVVELVYGLARATYCDVAATSAIATNEHDGPSLTTAEGPSGKEPGDAVGALL